jgi:hypothetical protein
VYWKNYEKDALNHMTGEKVVSKRRGLAADYELLCSESYGEMFVRLVNTNGIRYD